MEPVAASVGVWQAVLGARREELNALLARARAAGASPEALREALVEVGPAVEDLAARVPRSALDALAPALVAVVCELVQSSLWTERSPQRWAVLTVMASLPVALTRSPQACLDVLVTGAARLSGSTDLDAWGRRLAAADAVITTDDELRLAATVAAWRSGLVRSRGAALRSAAALPDAALAAVLDLPDAAGEPSARQTLAANAADPFSWPQLPAAGLVASYGGHRGLGGPWTSVPRVLGAHRADTPTWVVRTDESDWVLIADAHGHTVLRAQDSALTAVVEGPEVSPDAVVPALTWADEVTGAHRAQGAGGTDGTDGTRAAASGGAIPGGAVLVSRRTSYRVHLVRVP